MRLTPQTDGRLHPDGTADDHHAAPKSVSILNTTQSLPPYTTYNLDVPLGRDDFRLARVMLIGPNLSAGLGSWKECAELTVTRDAGDATGQSVKCASTRKVYSSNYSKRQGDSYLTHKIFNPGSGNYICVQDAVLTGSVLQLTFKSFCGGSINLNVRGQANLL